MKVIIIGAVAAGASTAARLRRLDENAQITIYERGPYMSYANCGLPYYVGGVIKEKENLLLLSPQVMQARFKVDVKLQHEVTHIDREKKQITVLDKQGNQEFTDSYDYLVLATGSSPFIPPLEGVQSDKILSLWTVDDSVKIKERILSLQAKLGTQRKLTVGVIGGGFIGMETAENLHTLGCNVAIIEATKQVMPQIDYEMAQLLHAHIASEDVKLYLDHKVEKFVDHDQSIEVVFANGQNLEFDVVIMAIGVRPNSQLAADCGLDLNARKGVVVDAQMHTNDPAILAAGDVVEIENFVTKQRDMIPLAGPANKQGRLVADALANLASGRSGYQGTQGTSVAKIFKMTMASSGVSAARLKSLGKQQGVDFDSIMINQNSHVTYYPGATPLTLKLIYELPSFKILGIQGVGYDGVEKRIDVVATAMRFNATATDLKNLELCYAPPYGAAKDPVNMLGFVAENVQNKLVKFCTYDFEQQLKDYQILDVREKPELMAYSVPGAVNIPFGTLRDNLDKLDRSKTIVVLCAAGVRAYNCARILMQNGFEQVQVYPCGAGLHKIVTKNYGSQGPLNFSNTTPSAGGAGTSGAAGTQGSCCSATTSCCSGVGGAASAPGVSSGADLNIVAELDCTALQCPGPLMKISQALDKLENGQTIKAVAADQGFYQDVQAFCQSTGNTLNSVVKGDKFVEAVITKGAQQASIPTPAVAAAASPVATGQGPSNRSQTIIVFSGDLDKVMAAFVIANGARAMGKEVTMFFTFWGLAAIRKSQAVQVEKSTMDKMFGMMIPRGAGNLKLSQMNMGGLGSMMMKKVMQDKHVDSLETLMQQAMANGVKIIACSMSMDVMGIQAAELIDGVEIGGVATYLGAADKATNNLFI